MLIFQDYYEVQGRHCTKDGCGGTNFNLSTWESAVRESQSGLHKAIMPQIQIKITCLTTCYSVHEENTLAANCVSTNNDGEHRLKAHNN